MLFMEDGMGKFVFESILLQEFLNSGCDERNAENLVNCRPPMHINSEHLIDKVFQIPRKVHWYLLELAPDNMHGKEVHVHTLKRWLESTHLIQHYA